MNKNGDKIIMEFKLGEYIEVGIGENVYDKDGYSYFFKMDREGYNEFDIEDVFDEKGNVLYVMSVDDESAIRFAGESKFSDFLEEK